MTERRLGTNNVLASELKLKNLSSGQACELLPDNLILLGYRGSIAHNMYVPQNNPDSIDDKDLMGVFVGPIEHYLGFGRDEVKEKFIDEWDVVSYEIRKFVGLLLKCNPNVLSLLWLPKRHLVFEHELGSLLRDNRLLFATKAAYHSFNGYAYAQFKRMTHLNQETQAEMSRLEQELERYGIDLNSCKLNQEQRDTMIEGGSFNGERLGLIADRYEGLKRQYYSGGYMGTKRRELVRRVGYDAKNAAHLIRLLRMGIEFLVEGELHVERHDAEQLLEIKRGEWSLERVKDEAERLFRLAEEAYVRSSLPAKPDTEKAEHLCMEIVAAYHGFDFRGFASTSLD